MTELTYRKQAAAGRSEGNRRGALESSRSFFRAWRQRLPLKQLILVTSQLSLMLETGNTISESLAVLSRQTEGTKVNPVLRRVAAGVSGGRTLTEAFAEQPAAFPKLFVSSVRAGEASGQLTSVFNRLELHLRKKLQLRESIRAALAYPAILSVLLFGVIIFMVTFVLPRFTAIFEGAGAILPLPTRILMAVGNATKQYWYLIPVGIILAVAGIVALFRSSRGRAFVDALLLRVPAINTLVKSVAMSSLARTLGMLLESGVPMRESIEVAKYSVRSGSYHRLMCGVERSVLQGSGFAAPFRDSELVDPVDQQMIQTGERTGSLPTVLTRLADYHDEQTDIKLKRLTAIMEPAFIILMGVFVGFVAMAVLLPLFKMASAIKMGS